MFYEGYTFQLYHFCRERYTKKRKEIRIYDKNTFHLSRQYLPKHYGGKRNDLFS